VREIAKSPERAIQDSIGICGCLSFYATALARNMDIGGYWMTSGLVVNN
jgi:hypothetical protein